MRTLAAFCYSKRWLVLGVWVVLLVVLTVASAAVGAGYRTDFELPGSESQEALDLLEERGVADRTGVSAQIVHRSEAGYDDPAVRARMEQFYADILAEIDGASISSPFDPANSFQVSEDGTIAYAELNLGDREQEEFTNDGDRIKEIWEGIDQPGLQVELGGDIFAEFSEPSSEAFGIAAAVVILIIAFGSLLAMGLPIATALFGVGCGVATIGFLTNVLAVPDFTTLIASLIGIGVGIDYALLIVTRYRAGLHSGMEPREAVTLAVDTSGRAVMFAGLTVVISLLGMFFLNLDFMRSVAVAAVAAVLFTMAASITLLPAFLGFVGRNIDRFGLPHRAAREEHEISSTFWYKWSRVIQKNPVPAMLLSAGLLIALTIPVFSLQLGFSDAGNRRETDTTRRAYDLLEQAFGPGFNGPIIVLVDGQAGPSDDATLSSLETALAGTEGVAQVSPPVPLGDSGLTLFNVFPTTSPQDSETTDLVHRLRDETIPPVAASTGASVLTTGLPPAIVDFSDYTGERLPIFIGAVLLLSFFLLLTVFHSVVVPLKAVIMNLLSIGAAFGLTIIVFQWGFGDNLLGVGREGPIEAWGPMFIFAIVFGLSMDYEVFLLARVREEYDRNGNNNTAAVADGLAATGRVISAAALIMVCVFGAFILGDDRAIKIVGFTLAAAIFIDATVVRLILVPAAMELLGKANWWAPSWLVRILPTIRVDAEPENVPAGVGGGSGGGGA
jgi:putative drug exporter of the RND superfamily